MNHVQSALIVVDVQWDYCSPDGEMSRIGKPLLNVEQTVENINKVIEVARSQGMKIVFIKTMHSAVTDSANWVKRLGDPPSLDVCRTELGQSFYKVTPLVSDAIVIKHRYSAFYGTDLDLILRAHRINQIICCGFLANVCVESTVREGFMLGYDTVTLSDCMSSNEWIGHQSAVYNLSRYFGRVITSEEWCEEYEL